MSMTLSRSSSLLAACTALLGLGLAGCGGRVTAIDPYPHASDYEISGIDVSKYQGEIDWRAVQASGVRFAWIKATEGGDHLDEKFFQNWMASKAAGVPRGAYHFAYWCRPGHEQAAWFLKNVPYDPDALPPVLDVEWNGNSRTCPKKIPREVALAQMHMILTAMERAYGKRPVIYTSVDFHRDVMQNEFNDYPIWVRSVKYYPTVKYGNRRWHFWQHTAEGHVPGIRGFVDRNAFNGNAREWQAWLQPSGRREEKPAPAPVTTTASIPAPPAPAQSSPQAAALVPASTPVSTPQTNLAPTINTASTSSPLLPAAAIPTATGAPQPETARSVAMSQP
ncbi:glycoside hydrolase family 25 protein [Beijerinckia indica]|uniref:Glycoside hydrolase family 25 n=1 Tax=Beijerinckia indica subsp. indica (strain ATCC 9039 / DSM 1715 / NCIMB 8712) TaxID=395963 RepID=B2IBZ1_BEII9|nr:GH25 family lysozyme [Beijerinckia indica]ACB95246.1 glycoside hydrolase family 25 [Beijerinckia indica subsp. indica ATCC 9039]